MKVIVGCERSGRVREAFRKRGHDAWSCDLEPSDDNSPYHIQDDILNHLNDGWDIGIFHPVCKYLANSGVKHLYVDPLRWQGLIGGATFFKKLLDCAIPKKAIENPIMHKWAKMIVGRGQDQVVQPWMFGHPEKKATCLWLDGLPKLQETNNVEDHMKTLSKKDQNKIHYMSPGPDREKNRSVTYQGIADAMASQWG